MAYAQRAGGEGFEKIDLKLWMVADGGGGGARLK